MPASEAPETAKAVAATTPATEAPTKPEAPAAEEPVISITDFCREASHGDKRVELIKGFYHFVTTTKGGRTRDTRKNFAARYVAFGRMPA